MKVRSFVSLAATFGASIMVSLAAVGQELPDYKTKVKVSVSATESIRSQVVSYVNRELRSLSDVEIVENDPNWILSIVAMELKLKGGQKTGYALSTVTLVAVTPSALTPYLQPQYASLAS